LDTEGSFSGDKNSQECIEIYFHFMVLRHGNNLFFIFTAKTQNLISIIQSLKAVAF
jgi:hypothetical protein